MKKIFKQDKGIALITTIIGLALMTILGFAIIGATTSNLRMTKIDSRSQSAYYIAEAGINYMIDKINTEIEDISESTSREDFFQHIENSYVNRTELEIFEKYKGEEPKASITISYLSKEEDMRIYNIESTGKIGNSRRTVNSEIVISWINQDNNGLINSLLFHSKGFSFMGTAVNAPSGSVVIDGIETHKLNGGSALNISNMYFNGPVEMNGGSASFGNKVEPGKIYVNGNLDFWTGTRNVYGEILVNGNFRLKDGKINGNVYVDGDVELGWTPIIAENIYYTGSLASPNNFNSSLLAKCIKVDSVDKFDIPNISFDLKDDIWYSNQGYEIKGYEIGTIKKDSKMLVDNYSNMGWQKIEGDIVIISKKDIILRGGDGFSGALIAPYGTVEYSGDGTFNGVIIAKNINLSKQGNTFNLKNLNKIFGEETDNIPIMVHNIGEGEGEGNDTTNSQRVNLIIKSNIREN